MLTLGSADHDLSGFDEGYGGVAGLEGELTDGSGRNDGGDALVADGEDDFGEETLDDDFDDGAEQLVAAADAAGAGMSGGGGEELVECFEGHAMMTAGGLDGADAPGQDPVLHGRIADADLLRCLAWRKQVGRGHDDL